MCIFVNIFVTTIFIYLKTLNIIKKLWINICETFMYIFVKKLYIFVKHLCINTCDQIKDDRCGTELARTSRYHLYLSAVSVSTFVHIYMCEHFMVFGLQFMVFGALCRSGTPRLRACLTSSSGRVTHTKVTGSKDSLGKINFCECFFVS